jgi:hypothetical protein
MNNPLPIKEKRSGNLQEDSLGRKKSTGNLQAERGERKGKLGEVR